MKKSVIFLTVMFLACSCVSRAKYKSSINDLEYQISCLEERIEDLEEESQRLKEDVESLEIVIDKAKKALLWGDYYSAYDILSKY